MELDTATRRAWAPYRLHSERGRECASHLMCVSRWCAVQCWFESRRCNHGFSLMWW